MLWAERHVRHCYKSPNYIELHIVTPERVREREREKKKERESPFLIQMKYKLNGFVPLEITS